MFASGWVSKGLCMSCACTHELQSVIRQVAPPPPCISYGLVQATVGVGTVLIWDFGVACTGGRGIQRSPQGARPSVPRAPGVAIASVVGRCFLLVGPDNLAVIGNH